MNLTIKDNVTLTFFNEMKNLYFLYLESPYFLKIVDFIGTVSYSTLVTSSTVQRETAVRYRYPLLPIDHH